MRGAEPRISGRRGYGAQIWVVASARAGLPPHRVLAGEQNLIELAATVAEAALVLCGDTGVAHLATA
ncbi:glycosyltransferase family 9 protein, partial [Nocardia cyriacigeorgica]|uniref:glycosyltransferase family 9 protein n=1 Tax=Nocardia cyriacigeorgica TaxID=135487 RepID=UPI003CC80ACB